MSKKDSTLLDSPNVPAVMEQQNYAVTQPGQVVMPFDDGQDAAELDTGLLLARLEYMRNERPENFREGWVTWSSGKVILEQEKEVACTILQFRMAFAMMPSVYNADNYRPECFSDDALTPHGGTDKQPGPCARLVPGKKREIICPMAQWGLNNEKPRCGRIFRVLAIRHRDNQPFIFTCKSTSIDPLQAFRAKCINEARKYGYPNIPVNRCIGLNLGGKKGISKNGPYWAWNFDGLSQIPQAQAQAYQNMYLEIMTMFQSTSVEHDVEDQVAVADGTDNDCPI